MFARPVSRSCAHAARSPQWRRSLGAGRPALLMVAMLLAAPGAAVRAAERATGGPAGPGAQPAEVEQIQAVEHPRKEGISAGHPADRLEADDATLKALPAHLIPIPADTPAPPLNPTLGPQELAAQEERRRLPRSVREMVTFDLATRTERRRPASSALTGETRWTRGGSSERDPDERLFQVDNYGPLGNINPTSGLAPRHVKIKMQWIDVDGVMRSSSCSGTLIDPKHVLTAGHCVFAWDDGQGHDIEDWAVSVTVFPGYETGEAPWGSAVASQLHSWTGWTEDEDYDSDIAVIDLNEPIGAITGWRGLGTTSDCDYFEGASWTKYSYPGEIYSGELMYLQAGTYDGCETNAGGWYGELVDYDTAPYKGQSGSSGIRDGVAWAVTSHSICAVECGGRDVRINHGKFDDIVAWLDADTPSAFDLVALDANHADDSVAAGSAVVGFNFLVCNYSDASYNGSVGYDVYLSTNTTISTSDIYVSSGGFNWNAAPLARARINVPSPVVPFDVPPGNYFMGVVVDFPADGNSGNNSTSSEECVPITVRCPTGSIPQPVFPEDDHPCVGTSVTLNWGSAGVGVTYQLEVSHWVGFNSVSTATYSTTSTQHTVTGLLAGTTYSWRVRARTTCGTYGRWSSETWGYFSFTTRGTLDPPSPSSPTYGSGCLAGGATLAWNASPHAATYRVQIGTSCGSGSVYVTGNTSYSISGLLPGTRYWWRVRGVDECGNMGPYSACSSFMTTYAAVPAPAPAGFATGSCFPGDVGFVWHRVSGASTYEVEIQNASSQVVGVYDTGGETEYTAAGLADDSYAWRVRGRACTTAGGEVWGNWSAPLAFTVDTQGPVLGAQLASTTHSPSVWSAQNQVAVAWDAASDGCSVAGYRYQWDQLPATLPDGTNQTTAVSLISSPLPSGQAHWFHLQAIDGLGQLSQVRHLGPFWIDTTDPERPIPTSTPPYGEWIPPGTISITWPKPLDAESGIAGYSFTWSTTKTSHPDATIETTEQSSTQALTVDGVRFFRVAAVDGVGNVSSSLMLQYSVDQTPPQLQLVSPNGGEVFAPQDDTIPVWFTVADATSGVASMALRYSVNGGGSWYDVATLGWPEIRRLLLDGDPYLWPLPWVPPGAEVLLRLSALDEAGNVSEDTSDAPFHVEVTTKVDLPTPIRFALEENAPNPFNPRTTIRYALPASVPVELVIFDQRGRVVRTLVRQQQAGPARYEVVWDGTDDRGVGVVSGVYHYRLRAGEFQETRRMALVQ